MERLDIVGFGLSTLDVVTVMKDVPIRQYGGRRPPLHEDLRRPDLDP